MFEHEMTIAGLFAEVEDALASLYKRCGAYYPRDFELWDNLSLDETQHAVEARKLSGLALKGFLRFRDNHAQAALLRSTLVYIEEVRQAVTDGAIRGDKALDMALKLEESMVEKGVFTQFAAADEESMTILRRLEKETGIHAREIRKTLEHRKAPAKS